jgi:RimJ/RimL family protein N-acetyltransferase
MTFETPRLFLRPTDLEDAEFIIRLMNSEKWLKFIGDRKVSTIEDGQNYIKSRMLPQLDRLGFSNFTVIRKSDDVKIGSCGLYDREGLEGVDLGFAFLPEYEGQGYAFESARVIRDASSAHFNIQKIQAITMEDNHGSRKLLEKLEFAFKKRIQLPNDPEELMLYVYEV